MFKRGNEIPTIDVSLVTIQAETDLTNEIILDTSNKIAVNVQTETQDAVKLVIKGRLVAQKPEEVTITGHTIVLTDNVFIPQVVKILQGGTITKSTKYTYTVPNNGLAAGDHYFEIAGGKFVLFNLSNALTSGATIEFNDVTGILKITSGTTTKHARQIVTTEPQSSSEITMIETEDPDVTKGYQPPVAGSNDKGTRFRLRAYSAVYNAAGEITGYERITYPNCKGTPVALSSEDGAFRASEYTIYSAPDRGEAPYVIDYVMPDELPTEE